MDLSNISKLLHPSWQKALREEFDKPYFKKLQSFLESERQQETPIYPEESLVFNAFAKTPLDSVKVVILGQDPYHGQGQAQGLSFSVAKGTTPPPSLKNIFKEMQADLGIQPSSHGCLDLWAEQGVLLLNTVLTVRAKTPKSHSGIGWELFTDAVLKLLCEKKDPLVFVLWGKDAFKKCQFILSTTNHPHAVLSAAHPSPYSASKFLGCRHFSKINECLANWNKSLIRWSLEP